MTSLIHTIRRGLAALLISGTLAAFAAEKTSSAGHPDASTWASLFNEDLSAAEYSKSVWTLKDGVFTAAKDESIWSKKTYENFILDLEFKNESGTNSGVIIRASDTANWIPHSIEVQIADDFSEKWSKMPATWHCAALFGHVPPTKSVVKKPGEWNRMTITCKGPIIEVALNGELVTKADLREHKSNKKNPDGSEIPAWLSTPFAQLATKGRIGLQGMHADASIFFRNVRIKEL